MGDLEILVDPMALAKMIQHTSSSVHKEVAGYLIGKIINDHTVEITDTAIARQHGTSVHVTLNDEDQAIIAERLEKEELNEVIIGWYHSHPHMGAHFFSSTDVDTQKRYEFFLKQAVGLVLDPYKYVMSGQPSDLDIHAWRVGEAGSGTDIPFKMMKDENRITLNILEHLKRQKVLDLAVSQIIYSLNPKLEQSLSEMLNMGVTGAISEGKGIAFRKIVLFSVLIQALVLLGVFFIVWAIILMMI
ncbi:MAG: Mov34/MPN/PAD-1 family protein [Candidatus Helarchaeota archaeon]|nr:Mov34/MPN/PAD-1 family protein [Candidatus Helarchaeota archaeon]